MHRSPVAPRRPRPLQFFSSFSTSPPATTPVCPSSCPSFPRSTLAFILPHRQSRGWALLPPTPSPARALFPPQPLCRSSVCLELGRVSFPLPLLLASSRHPRSTPNAACVHPSHPTPHSPHPSPHLHSLPLRNPSTTTSASVRWRPAVCHRALLSHSTATQCF